MNVRDSMSAACMMKEADTGAVPLGENDSQVGMVTDARSKLVDFVVHRVFYPVLMLQRTGPHKARIEHMQDTTHAEIERFRTYGSIEEVVVNYKRYFESESARNIGLDLELLNFPTSSDVHEGFEKKVRELGFEPDTFLTSLDLTSNAGLGAARDQAAAPQPTERIDRPFT
jgi:hypothetical protein